MWNRKKALQARTDHFLEHFSLAIENARALVTQRDVTGRNAFLSPYEMFPHGPQSVLDQVWMKVGRALGYVDAGRWDLADAEMADVLNYAGFYEVVRRDWGNQIRLESPGLTAPQAEQGTQPGDRVFGGLKARMDRSASERPAHEAPRRVRTGPDPEDFEEEVGRI